ncbi:hypothetical protein CR513_34154, partial [Mucuna pruriens]
MVKEVHEGVCSTHIGGRALASKIAKADLFQATKTKDLRGSVIRSPPGNEDKRPERIGHNIPSRQQRQRPERIGHNIPSRQQRQRPKRTGHKIPSRQQK